MANYSIFWFVMENINFTPQLTVCYMNILFYSYLNLANVINCCIYHRNIIQILCNVLEIPLDFYLKIYSIYLNIFLILKSNSISNIYYMKNFFVLLEMLIKIILFFIYLKSKHNSFYPLYLEFK